VNILIIDDDLGIRQTLGAALESEGHAVACVVNGAAAEKKLRGETFEVAFLDLRLGAENGLELLPELVRLSPRLAVIVITAYSSVESAVAAIQRGAFDYLPKPFKPAQIKRVLERVAETRRLETRVAELESNQARGADDAEIEATHDPALKRLLEVARKAASSQANILLSGESGTGKSVLARHIHRWSSRQHEPFVTLSCPSLSRDLLESELFGHVRGAFTGAISSTQGQVAAADRGTLFLDEIGELPLEVQPKLLRLLQEREYERVGETKIQRADVRVIAATNRNLKDAVTAGLFREDLLYRLDVMSLRMPALRERPSDIVPLAEHWLRHFARQSGKKLSGFSDDAAHLLQRHAWPGNIRELRNVIEHATILASGEKIETADLPSTVEEFRSAKPALGGDYSAAEIEAEHIRLVLERAPGIQEAADLLGIDRSTLLRKRKSLNL
jgi:NtrC-family two-component system response regulator AlgB